MFKIVSLDQLCTKQPSTPVNILNFSIYFTYIKLDKNFIQKKVLITASIRYTHRHDTLAFIIYNKRLIGRGNAAVLLHVFL